MYVKDIVEDATEVFGACKNARFYRRLTDAVRRLNNKGLLDANLAQADFIVYDGLVTLPADVESVLAVMTNGKGTFMRSEWYQYSLSDVTDTTYETKMREIGFTVELGQVSTYRDPDEPFYVVAVLSTASDNNKLLKVYGWDANGDRIFSTGPNGETIDGFYVPTVFGSPARAAGIPALSRIDRVEKSETVGYVSLVAIKPSDNSVICEIGNYQPTETEPRYRRISVEENAWVRVKYRRKDFEVKSDADWVNLDNREALLQSCKAVKFAFDGQYALSQSADAEATRLMRDMAAARNPGLVASENVPQRIRLGTDERQEGNQPVQPDVPFPVKTP